MTESISSPTQVALADLLKLSFSAQRLPVLAQSQAAVQDGVGFRSLMQGRGMEFNEVRAYQAGDDIRHMDWRVMARTGQPHTKLYQEERSRPVLLVVDYSQSMHFATKGVYKSVVAARLAAFLGWSAVHHGEQVGGVIFADGHYQLWRPGILQKSFLPFLQGLASTDRPQGEHTGLATALSQVGQATSSGYLVLLVSDFYECDSSIQDRCYELARRHSLVLCQVLDPLELAPPPAGSYHVTNGHEQASFDTQRADFCADYQAWCDQRQHQLAQLARRCRCPRWLFKTDEPVWDRLHAYLRGKR